MTSDTSFPSGLSVVQRRRFRFRRDMVDLLFLPLLLVVPTSWMAVRAWSPSIGRYSTTVRPFLSLHDHRKGSFSCSQSKFVGASDVCSPHDCLSFRSSSMLKSSALSSAPNEPSSKDSSNNKNCRGSEKPAPKSSPPQQVLKISCQVCQDKHCAKKYPHLRQTMTYLLDGVAASVRNDPQNHDTASTLPTIAVQPHVESSSCQSHCEHGPNAQLHFQSVSCSNALSSSSPSWWPLRQDKQDSSINNDSKSYSINMHGLTNASMIASQWQQHPSSSMLSMHKIPPMSTLLIAACNVMDKAKQIQGTLYSL